MWEDAARKVRDAIDGLPVDDETRERLRELVIALTRAIIDQVKVDAIEIITSTLGGRGK